eukprot:7659436-Lingulodinium_polyedra.AAC.1
MRRVGPHEVRRSSDVPHEASFCRLKVVQLLARGHREGDVSVVLLKVGHVGRQYSPGRGCIQRRPLNASKGIGGVIVGSGIRDAQ